MLFGLYLSGKSKTNWKCNEQLKIKEGEAYYTNCITTDGIVCCSCHRGIMTGMVFIQSYLYCNLDTVQLQVSASKWAMWQVQKGFSESLCNLFWVWLPQCLGFFLYVCGRRKSFKSLWFSIKQLQNVCQTCAAASVEERFQMWHEYKHKK